MESWQDQLLLAAPGSHLQKRCASLVSTSESLLWLLPSKILHQPRTLFKQLSEAAEAPRNSLCSLDFSELEDKVSSFVNVFFTGLTRAAAGLRKVFRAVFPTNVSPDLSARLRL